MPISAPKQKWLDISERKTSKTKQSLLCVAGGGCIALGIYLTRKED
jgi:hypothetical protein